MPRRRRYLQAMRIVRIILQAMGGIFVAMLLAGAVIYVMACRVPPGYPGRPLPPARQRRARDRLQNHILRFGNKTGPGRPFTWTITATQANEYLASLDAIAELSDRPVSPTAEMERAGFIGPAVAMRDGVLTLMIRARRWEKILSVDAAFQFDARGNLTVRTLAMRVGAMPVPQCFLADVHQRARRQLARQLAEVEKVRDGSIGQVPVAHFARLLRNILGMLDGQYVRPEVVWPLGRHRVRIDRVEIAEGRLTLHAVPIRPRRPRPATAPANLEAKNPK